MSHELMNENKIANSGVAADSAASSGAPSSAVSKERLLRETATYLFHLMGCALRDAPADPKPETITWEHVFRLSMRNSVQGLAWFGAKGQPDLPDDLRERWEREANKVLFRRARFDMERAEILAELDQLGLSYLPLKGIHLANYYPRPEMRAMCDNDILYGRIEPAPDGGFKVQGETERDQDRVTEQAVKDLVRVMEARGYETRSAFKGNHEMFLKAPFFNFEMHRRLSLLDGPFGAYYENPWKRAVQDSGNPHEFRFSHEDEYIYMIVHAFKHFDHAGCGVRILADIWTFNQAKGMLLNWAYIREELEILGLLDFEQQLRGIALKGLDGEELASDQLELVWYMAGSGTYGTVSQHLENAAKKVNQEGEESGSVGAAKARYLWQRMFGTGEEYLRQNYPFFYRHKAARPFFALYRIFRALTRNQASTLREAKAILRSGKK